MKLQTAFRCLSRLLALSTVSSCAFADVKKQYAAEPPAEKPGVIVVGRIKVADSRLEKDLTFFRKGLLDQLEDDGGFDRIIDEPLMPAFADALVISGTLVTIDPGDEAKRLLLGFGAGEARVEGIFKLQSADGESLLVFTASKAYSGASLVVGDIVMRGWFVQSRRTDFCMGDLLNDLGKAVAVTVIRWTEGKSVD